MLYNIEHNYHFILVRPLIIEVFSDDMFFCLHKNLLNYMELKETCKCTAM